MRGARPRGEMLLHLVGAVMHVDHGRADAGFREGVEDVIDQWPAGHLDQRLGDRFGDRPHAQPEPGGEHHGAIGNRRAGRLHASC